MEFTSVGFLGFLSLLVLVHALAPTAWRTAILVAGSYYFYWLCSGWFALLLLSATLIAFYAARTKSLPMLAVAALVAMLIFFKAVPLTGIGWLLPLGVSYYTFKLAGYLIDAHWGAIEPERRLLPFLAFAAFFPQIVGGPIQRADSFLPQVGASAALRLPTVVAGVLRILLGFFKKFVVADNLGQIVGFIYRHLTNDPGAPVLLGFYGYPLQMYADFSALSDIAIGAGVLFGIESPENFNAPFFAASPSEFWRRWHMTLTLWMTDYVFTPLRMATRALGNPGIVVSLFLNMVLIGLWHGFNLMFALFGVVHAIYLSADALSQKWRKRWYRSHPLLDRATDAAGPIVTFHLIAVAFVLFRSDSIATARLMFVHLFDGIGPLSPAFKELIVEPAHLLRLGVALVLMECADALRRRYWARPLLEAFPRWGRWSVYACTVLALFLAVLLVLTHDADTSPFIYAIF